MKCDDVKLGINLENLGFNMNNKRFDQLIDWLKSINYTISKDEFIKQLKNITSLQDSYFLNQIWDMYEEIYYEEKLNDKRFNQLNEILENDMQNL